MNHQTHNTNHSHVGFHELIHSIFYALPEADSNRLPTPVTTHTQLCEPHEFGMRLHHAMHRAYRSHQSLALILLNVTGNLPLNSHTSTRIARHIRSCLRMSDSLLQDPQGNFAILLDDIQDPDTTLLAVEKIRHTLAIPIQGKHDKLDAIIHAGISIFPIDGYHTRSLWNSAQTALQRAIPQEAGCFEFANERLARQSKEKMAMSTVLHHAIRNEEFELYYQPIMSTMTGCAQRVEALLRWNHPTRGLLSPEQFLPLLEETGFMIPVGERVLETLYRQACHLQQSGHFNITLSVNISERQLLEPDFVRYMESLAQEREFDLSLVEFECPETTLIENLDVAREILPSLVRLGIPVTIDHFGCNSYALGELMRLPVTGLKIDRELIQCLPFDRTYKAITGGILTFAEGLGIRVSAIGVENIGQLQFLRERSCHEVQGNLFARPMPFSELQHWLPN